MRPDTHDHRYAKGRKATYRRPTEVVTWTSANAKLPSLWTQLPAPVHRPERSFKIRRPVGYAIYFDSTSLDTTNLHPALSPIASTNLPDGILILKQHEHRVADRVKELFHYWSTTSEFAGRGDFGEAIDRFIGAVWPSEALDNVVGRKIAFDQRVWLKLDERQHRVVKDCMEKNTLLVAGFSGTGRSQSQAPQRSPMLKQGAAFSFC